MPYTRSCMVMVLPSTTVLGDKKMNVMPGILLSERLGNQYLDILVIWNAYRKTMLRIPPKKQKKTYRKIVDKRIFAFSHGIVDRKCWLYCCLVSSITKKYNALKRNTTSLWDISVVNQQYNQALLRWPFVDRHRQRSCRTHCSSSWERTA